MSYQRGGRKLSEQKKIGWKPFFNLIFKSKLPWGLYILTFVVMMSTASVTLMSPLILQKIMAGEIFYLALLFQHIYMTIVSAFNVSLSGFSRFFAHYPNLYNFHIIIYTRYY